MEKYDYVIAGAGAAGLSLAYHLNRAGLSDKTILLIDRAPKSANDRTWCFWERGNNVYEPIVYRRWGRIAFHGTGYSKVFDLNPYSYKMIRGEDFYRFTDEVLRGCPNVTRAYGAVDDIAEAEDGAVVRAGDRTYRGTWVFNSVRQPQPPRAAYHDLLQHFLGWVIASPQPVFDPAVATLMDFRIDQRADTRFCYVLPFDAHRALVEFTVFSRELLPLPEYTAELEAYLRRFLRLESYTVEHTEFGAIPMTDAPFETHPSPHVINIGTAGGRTKPSTGYTFLRIQEQSRRIAQALKTTGRPLYAQPLARRRFTLYDSVLLNVLDRGRSSGREVFTDLFRGNRVATVLRFLDEETNLLEELSVLMRSRLKPFTAAMADVTVGRLLRRLTAIVNGVHCLW